MRTQEKKGQLKVDQDHAVAHIKLIQGKSAMTVHRGVETSPSLPNSCGLLVLTAVLRLWDSGNLYGVH